jgi:hypothetical protein
LPREGISDRESIARVTAGEVETILAALSVRVLARNRRVAHEEWEATEVSEWVAQMGYRETGRKSPFVNSAIHEAIRAS